MSIVPYNTNHDILYHDPNHGILVLHNNQQNTIQLVSTNTRELPNQTFGPRDSFEFGRYSPNHTCPNCGFVWKESGDSSQKRPSTESNGVVRVGSVEPKDHGNTFYGGLPQGFMHHDYFKLLAQLPPVSLDSESPSEVDNHQALPEDIFNQGYFKRFFKKVPPYTLGSGAHAQVYKVHHVLNDIKLGTYAVKRIGVGNKIELLESVLNEVLILYELSVKGANENNLIRYNHVWLEMGDLEDSNTYFLPDIGKSKGTAIERTPYVFILQQYCAGGHLEDLINRNFNQENSLSWEEKVQRERLKRRNSRGRAELPTTNNRDWPSDIEIWKLFRDVVNGVNYLHLHGILHRDLKPSNCLLDEKYGNISVRQLPLNQFEFERVINELPKVLVSDFGEGKFIDKHSILEQLSPNLSELDSDDRKGNTGTLEYTAPELWLFSNYDPTLGVENKRYINDFTYESDIYSLGLILCYLTVGKLPFTHMIQGETDPQTIRTKIIDWYFGLTRDSFHEWFVSARTVAEPSECMNEFESLVYMMIKGDGENENSPLNRASAGDVLRYLDNMKTKRFLIHSRYDDEIVEPRVLRPRASSSRSGTSDFLLEEAVESYDPREDPTSQLFQRNREFGTNEVDPLMKSAADDQESLDLSYGPPMSEIIKQEERERRNIRSPPRYKILQPVLNFKSAATVGYIATFVMLEMSAFNEPTTFKMLAKAVVLVSLVLHLTVSRPTSKTSLALSMVILLVGVLVKR